MDRPFDPALLALMDAAPIAAPSFVPVMTASPAPTVSSAPIYDTDDARWAAVRERDQRADGAFVYAVRTTGVYCRPSSSARRPRRENVEFFATAAAAEAAGYRPSRRAGADATDRAAERAATVARACQLIDEADTMPSLDDLARDVGMSPWHFHRLFRSETGVTPRAWAAAARARRLRERLGDARTVTDAIYEAGYGANSRFYESADTVLGMRATDFRAGGARASIRFAIGQCSLGAILVAASERGVCSITLGEDPETLVRELQDRFPKAELIGADPGFEALVARVVGFVEAPGVGLDLPLDVRGTAFQQRVWQALREIPVGSTTSYAEIARRIGKPTAARAVARACATNPIAIAIPCHRVVRRDGDLSGYRWGIQRKRELLAREATSAPLG